MNTTLGVGQAIEGGAWNFGQAMVSDSQSFVNGQFSSAAGAIIQHPGTAASLAYQDLGNMGQGIINDTQTSTGRGQLLGDAMMLKAGTGKGTDDVPKPPTPKVETPEVPASPKPDASPAPGAQSASTTTAQTNEQVTDVTIDASKYPESAKHVQEAQASGQPSTLTIDRNGAKANRKAAMKGQAKVPGKDRDEYPPAMFQEGGKGASVKPLPPSDNRGSGSSMMHQTKDLPDKSKVRITVTNSNG